MRRRNDDPAVVEDHIATVRARRPRLTGEHVTLAHGAGGKASAALTDAIFLEALRNPHLEALDDGAVLDVRDVARVAVSTDTFVVRPWRFPGGTIGSLAVHGTVNDLACQGAQPRWLTVGFVIEEGFSFDDLRTVVADLAAAAAGAGVQVVAGDTKVVDSDSCDGVYVNTTGVGVVPDDVRLDAAAIGAGDKVLVSGPLADHGMAVMLARGDLHLDADIVSDSAPLHGLVADLLAAAPDTRFLRDATRGGVGTVLNEVAVATGLGIVLSEAALPVRPTTLGACDLLGIDPIYVANEGVLVVVVPEHQARAALEAMHAHRYGAGATVIGAVREQPAGTVLLQTTFGGTRVVDMLVGDPLPRIC
ncbi:MAG: hydrogenase expression/formation protein HypE [Actinomycetes bacterium]